MRPFLRITKRMLYFERNLKYVCFGFENKSMFYMLNIKKYDLFCTLPKFVCFFERIENVCFFLCIKACFIC